MLEVDAVVQLQEDKIKAKEGSFEVWMNNNKRNFSLNKRLFLCVGDSKPQLVVFFFEIPVIENVKQGTLFLPLAFSHTTHISMFRHLRGWEHFF